MIHNKFIKTLSILAILLVVVLIILKLTDKQDSDDKEVLLDQKITACGIEVLSPLENEKVENKFRIHAVVDNTKRKELGCGWIVFEGQAGVARVYDEKNFSVGSALLTTEEEWMNDGPTNFYADIEIDIDPNGEKLVLSITEDDPADSGVFDVINIPLLFQK